MATRLIRVLRTCALGALGFNALFPLDAISGEKLLYSNPRLLRSSQLGETCPTPLPMRSMALFASRAEDAGGCPRRSEAAPKDGSRSGNDLPIRPSFLLRV
jgi:hypothetical protein